MKIGELASAAQCTVETIRYYERQRLLPKPERGENNYRVYGTRHLERLIFIRNCRTLDMSQEEIGELLAFQDQPGGNCDAVNALLDDHIEHVTARLRELRSLQTQLIALRKKCGQTTTVGKCRILHGISHITPRRRPREATHLA